MMVLFDDTVNSGHVGEDEQTEHVVCDTLQNVGHLACLGHLLVSL